MTPATPAVGTDIRARCAICKRTQHHIITSILGKKIDKIQCKVCSRSRKYRTQDGAEATAKRRLQEAAVPPEIMWKKLMDGSSTKKTIVYTFDKQYRVHDLINHDTFGLGVVTSLPGPDKARVAFKAGELLLICNR
jgi:hypothetical protein